MKKKFPKLYVKLYLFFILSLFAGRTLTNIIEIYTNKIINFRNIIEQSENWSFSFNNKKINFKIPKKNSIIDLNNKKIKVIEHKNIKMVGNYPLYSIIIIALWLFPVYKYNFSKKKKYSKIIEKRILNFPIFLFVLIWTISFYQLIYKLYYFHITSNSSSKLLIGLHFAVFLTFGSILTIINMGYTIRYINDNIAYPIFAKNNLYNPKNGFSITISQKVMVLIITLGIMPILINIFILFYFNIDMFKNFYDSLMNFLQSGFAKLFIKWANSTHSIILKKILSSIIPVNIDLNSVVSNSKLVELIKISINILRNNIGMIVPLFFMIIIGFYFIITQILSIFSFKKSIQKPIDKLLKRMESLSKGDFDCKTSVLGTDEIGKLKSNFNIMVDGLIERDKIKDTFGKFVSMEIAKKIMETGKINLKGEEIKTTVLFTDIRNFTPLSEKMTAVELVEFLNLYFSYLVKVIHKHNGVVNKFIGDAILAIFSPIFDVEDHCDSALKAAIDMREALKEFNLLKKYPEIKFGIGIHTGRLVAGNIGTDERMEFTVIGDTVNVASRIESQTKIFQTDILISDALKRNIILNDFKEHKFIECEPVIMKGKSKPMILYKVN